MKKKTGTNTLHIKHLNLYQWDIKSIRCLNKRKVKYATEVVEMFALSIEDAWL